MKTNVKKLSSLSHNEAAVLLLMILFLAGVFIGTMLFGRLNGEQLESLGRVTGSLIDNRLGQTFLQTLMNSFSGAFVLLLGCFILGYSAVSQPVEIIIPVFRGLGMGVSLAGMYSRYGIRGFGMSMVLIIPGGIISAFVLMFAVREALRMSGSICMIIFSDRNIQRTLDHKLYFTKFVILTAILVISSLIDSLFTFLFADFWTGLL